MRGEVAVCFLKTGGLLLKNLIRSFKDWRIGRLPSRIFLERTAIPALAAAGHRRMLCVGTRSYNRALYRRCVAEGISVWSIDMDPAAAAYSAPDGHMVGNICDIETLAAGRAFDVIIFNGVLAWGLNDAAEARRAGAAMAKVTTPGGLLLIGWNPGRTDDSEIAAMRPGLAPASVAGLPSDITFPPHGRAQRHPHRYELFTFVVAPRACL